MNNKLNEHYLALKTNDRLMTVKTLFGIDQQTDKGLLSVNLGNKILPTNKSQLADHILSSKTRTD